MTDGRVAELYLRAGKLVYDKITDEPSICIVIGNDFEIDVLSSLFQRYYSCTHRPTCELKKSEVNFSLTLISHTTIHRPQVSG